MTAFTFTGFSQVIKIGTMAPPGSLWDTTLKEIAAEWSRISSGRIKVKIYTGGSIGNEEDIIRKMKLGRLQGAALTSQGMSNIDPDLLALSLPMKISDDDEFDYVFDRIIPSFNDTLDKKGFTAVAWTMSGWVKWFTTSRVSTPSDLAKLKIAVDNSDEKVIQIWKKIGFKVIPLSLPTSCQDFTAEWLKVHILHHTQHLQWEWRNLPRICMICLLLLFMQGYS